MMLYTKKYLKKQTEEKRVLTDAWKKYIKEKVYRNLDYSLNNNFKKTCDLFKFYSRSEIIVSPCFKDELEKDYQKYRIDIELICDYIKTLTDADIKIEYDTGAWGKLDKDYKILYLSWED